MFYGGDQEYVHRYSDIFSGKCYVRCIQDVYNYSNIAPLNTIQEYKRIGPFNSDGIAWAKLNNSYGYINEDYSIAIDFEYTDANSFSEDLALVKQFGKYGYINKLGEVVIPFHYTYAYDFSEGLAAVQIKEDGNFGFINKQGEIVLPFKYNNFYGLSFSEGLAVVSENGKYGYIDKFGNTIIAFKYDYALNFSEGLAACELNNKTGYINKGGETVIDFQYEHGSLYSNNIARVGILTPDSNTAIIFINKQGQNIFGDHYERASQQKDGYFIVEKSDKYSILKNTGEVIVPFEFDSYYISDNFLDGSMCLKRNGKWVFIDSTGNQFIKEEYDTAYPFDGEFAEVFYNNNWSYIDKDANIYEMNNFNSYSWSYLDDYAFVTNCAASMNLEEGVNEFIDKNGCCECLLDFYKTKELTEEELLLGAISQEEMSKASFRCLLYNSNAEFITRTMVTQFLPYNDLDSAIELANLATIKARAEFSADSIDLATYLMNNAFVYKESSKLKEAEKLYIEAKQILVLNNDTNSDDYIRVLSNLGEIQYETENISGGIETFEELISKHESSSIKDSLDYAGYLMKLGNLYIQNFDLENGEKYLVEAKELRESIFNKYLKINNMELSDLSPNKFNVLMSDDFIDYGNNEMMVYLAAISYSVPLNNLADFYKVTSQYDKAIEYQEKSIDIIKRTFGKESFFYSTAISNLAGIYYYEYRNQSRNRSNISKAEDLLSEAYILNTLLFGDSVNVYQVFPSLTTIHIENENYESAEELLLETSQYFYKNDTLSLFYADHLGLFSAFYSMIGEYEKALELINKSLSIIELKRGKDHHDYIGHLEPLAMCYYGLGKYENVGSISISILDMIEREKSKLQLYMSENEKLKLLQSYTRPKHFAYSMIYSIGKLNDNLSIAMYNHELFSKSSILNQTKQFNNQLYNANKSNNKLIYRLNYFKTLLETQSNLDQDERWLSIKAIEDSISRIERQIISYETQNHSVYTVADIMDFINKNQVAIEYVSFQYHNGVVFTDSIIYMALVLRLGDEQPHLIPLFEQKQIDSLFVSTGQDQYMADLLYRGGELTGEENFIDYSQRLYELVWQPFAHLIPDGSDVYFAPSGTLHQISFAAIMCDDSTRLSDKYNLNRVSTTAKLVEEPKTYESNDIVLFGGINYDTDTDTRKTIAEEIGEYNDLASRSLPEDLDRGSNEWTYLKGTENEVIAISELANSNNVSSTLYKGDEALEDQFKQMSSPSPRYVHVATHGFFFPDPEKKYDYMSMTMGNEQFNVFKMSDNPLNRAGLLFSGANAVWTGGERPEGLDDGILTAYEASNLNLWNTELVVLSACETGLGEIKGSEGVFGLQRAFMAAGANYIIMSLWKVPDKETSEFMTRFYEELFAGKTIPEAFNTTREYMKNKYRNEPYKWAAFVLVR